MKDIFAFLQSLKEKLEVPLYSTEKGTITLWTIFFMIFFLILLFYLSSKLKKFLVQRVFKRYIPELGVRQAIATIVRYVIVIIGLFIIIQSAGINLTSLTVLAGALGVGIGFGLQNVTNNFVSGIVILFERPIKVGDRIEVGGTSGDVMSISARATTILTNDNISIIVPNSEFMSERVINWSYTDSRVRFKVPVTISYDADPKTVRQLLLEVAAENKDVLETPEPTVRLQEFSENGIQYQLVAWTASLMQRQGKLHSDINFAMHEKLKKHDIEIPYPQRDLHLKSGFPEQYADLHKTK